MLNVNCEAYMPNTYVGMYVFYCHATLLSLDSFLLSTLLSHRTHRLVYW